MRIEDFNGMEIIKQSGTVTDRGAHFVATEELRGLDKDPLNGHAANVRKSTYDNPALKASEEVAAAAMAEESSFAAKQKEMAVVSNTMSEDDFKEYRDNGNSLHNMDSKEIMTVVDKIKLSLAKSGNIDGEISLSDEAIREAGGEAVLSAIQNAYAAADLPLTEDNLKETEKTLSLSAGLTEFPEGAVKYMLQRELEPTVENLYVAKASGTAAAEPPLVAKEGSQLREQIVDVIGESSLPVDQKTVEKSLWMLGNDIPLTASNIEKAEELSEMKLPPTPEETISAAVEAVRSGKRPMEADFLALRREREEARLVMTDDARKTMEKLGVEADVTGLSERLEELKKEESAYYESYLKQAETPVTDEAVDLFAETEKKLTELKEMPAYVLPVRPAVGETDSLNRLHELGSELKLKLDKAGEAYDTMRTEIRKDLGDSIQKAFRNISDRLEAMDLPDTAENRRAVRILSYNRIDLTEENLIAVKAKDAQVNRAFENLTPRVVAEFIKTGENPLDLDITELNEKALAIRREVGIPEEEKYSEFLVKLEANKGITPEERDSYIGIYRMIRQIEESDGAAVGALVAEGAEVTLQNLMTAVRSSKRSMDYTVDDGFGGVKAKEKSRNSTQQALTAFHQSMIYEAADALSPETLKSAMERDERWQEKSPEEFARLLKEADTAEEEEEYVSQELKSFSDAAKAEEEVYRALERFDLPTTVENIEILHYMMNRPNAAVRKLFGMEKDAYRTPDGEVDFEEIKKDLLRQFGEAADTPEDMAKAQKNLADIAENVMKTMLTAEDTKTAVDVRELRLMAGQFRLASRMARQEQYHIPIQVQGETGEMTLKIVNGTEEKGIVDIQFTLSSMGSVAAKLRAAGQNLTGYIAAERPETAAFFREREERFSGELAGKTGFQGVKLSVVEDRSLDLRRFSTETDRENDGITRDGDPVTTKQLYRAAKAFLSLLN